MNHLAKPFFLIKKRADTDKENLMEEIMTLAEQLKICRERNGLSQNNVAEKLNLSRQSVSKWETGQCYPTIDNLTRLSELYNTPIEQFLTQDKQNKDQLVNNSNNEESDESMLLLLVAGLASFIFPIGLILNIFVYWRNKKSNSFYKLVYIVCVFSIFFNLYDGYIHLANYKNWGTTTIEKIE